ncbi:hypothetical protein LOY64_04345 [Pseudomonas corrugata]|uniref:hypothetical protein n=1 Tax=Pseudomonas corrugata TaxID=47879 RepID=UPI0022328497|nr:hypothetical protein [Pseudomonas corrugata]UZD96243.1 hypothetical protein LOY64_04345 [Pseudomonas corrugata]
MDQLKGGGPAFPVTPDNDVRTNSAGGTGMTLRDYFAAKAMQGMISNTLPITNEDGARTSVAAFRMADAMLAARGEA